MFILGKTLLQSTKAIPNFPSNVSQIINFGLNYIGCKIAEETNQTSHLTRYENLKIYSIQGADNQL